ncbi:hypothetical protein F5Y06DRAFT_292316 [Hypoxylon sp. FL0890]|nr:hypothetical protein F5Y06DRAFT_292316 [Hypoxylon sp. FL0890]
MAPDYHQVQGWPDGPRRLRDGPTAFPVIYALIVGGAIRSLALWRLQAGERIYLLDLLLGSTTVGSTIATQLNNINSAFMATLASSLPIRESSLDPWGNIKIPAIESLLKFDSADNDDWVSFAGYSDATPYSSLIGIPVANVSRVGVTEFTLETTYWNLHCPEYGYSNDYTWLEEIDTVKEGCIDSCLVYNKPVSDGCVVDGLITRWGAILSKTSEDDITRRCHEGTMGDVPKRQLVFQSWNDRGTNRAKISAACTLGTTYIEALVKCDRWDCTVGQLRKSQKRRRPKSLSYTALDPCPSKGWVGSAATFLSNFVDAAEHYLKSSSAIGILQGYIFSPNRPFSEMVNPNSELDLSLLGNESFAVRFSQLLNTYFSAYYNYNLTFERHPQNLAYESSYYFSNDPTMEIIGTNTRLETRFVFSRGWMAVLVLSTSAMFTSSIIKFVFDLKIWIPDLLMNVSTLLRGSMSHCPNLPYGRTTLDDSDSSRLLKDRMVRFGKYSG